MKKKWLVKTLTLGVVVLFIGAGTVSAINTNQVDESKPLSRSNTLYVGGSGPNNYTKIQDAIDDASDGDTVFVYDDSSPYYEKIRLNKSINLIGEDKNSTIINAEGSGCAIKIFSDYGGNTINGFTLQTSPPYNGIEIMQTNILIENCIITDSQWGMNFISKFGYIIIKQCVIKNNTWGIVFGFIRDCKVLIEGNIISSNADGIYILGGQNSEINISNNSFEKNSNSGLWLHYSRNDLNISGNTFKQNKYGIYIESSGSNKIYKNNFMHNKRANADFAYDITYKVPVTLWFENYWSPRFIRLIPSNSKFPEIIRGWKFYRYLYFGLFIIPFFNFDWHPAKEPYDILIVE